MRESFFRTTNRITVTHSASLTSDALLYSCSGNQFTVLPRKRTEAGMCCTQPRTTFFPLCSIKRL